MAKVKTTRKGKPNLQQREFNRLEQAEKDLFRIIDHATETLCRLIDNEAAVLKYYVVRAGLAVEKAAICPQVADNTWTVEQAERYLLADCLKETIGNIVEGEKPAQFGALLGQCFVVIGISLVSWDDVAKHYLTKYREAN